MSGQRWFIALSPDGAARSVSMHIARAFSLDLQERCKTFDTFTYRQAFSTMLVQHDDNCIADLLNQSLIVSCLDFKATHLLVTALAPVTLFTLNLVRAYGITTVHWLYEDFRRARYWNDVLSGYDHFCAIQHGPLEVLCKQHGRRFHFFPTACCGAELHTAPGVRTTDITFIGIPSVYRIAVLEKLAATGRSLLIAGSGWKNYRGPLEPSIVKSEWVDTAAAYDLLQKAKIGINLSVEEPLEPEHAHVSPRVYDVLAAGCVLVTEQVPLLAEFLPDCTCHTFDGIDRVCETVNAVLAGYDTLGSRIDANRKTVLSNHTYRKRREQLAALVGGG
ncbi:MAG: glycosyltransferase family 1 protein [Chitinispirillaceae bacterium]|nr:glycosyltransferase family 1 protein [Chitinispirillaceae bacterium]